MKVKRSPTYDMTNYRKGAIVMSLHQTESMVCLQSACQI